MKIYYYADNPSKGLGIFSYSNYKFKLYHWHNPLFRMALRIQVSNTKHQFNMFVIWANNPNDKNNQYVEQVWKAINHYSEYLCEANTIMIGDFNSNKIWDKIHRIGSHSQVVSFLEQKNIHSLYHKFFNERQGKETRPTFFMYRHENKPYHIDYCFASESFSKKLKSINVGKYSDWIGFSDHMPVIIVFQ